MPQAKVTESDVLPALLAVCPSFRQCWDEYVSDEAYVPNQVYVDAGEFARVATIARYGPLPEAAEAAGRARVELRELKRRLRRGLFVLDRSRGLVSVRSLGLG